MSTIKRCSTAMEATGSAEKLNTENIAPFVYLNCGCWQGSRTEFALVSEGAIVCGTWLKHDSSAGPWQYSKHEAIHHLLKDIQAPKIKAFFLGAPMGQDNSPRAYPILEKIVWVPHFRFTEPGQLMVFVGDCHIQLLKGWLNDGFIRPMQLADGSLSPNLPATGVDLPNAPTTINFFEQRVSLSHDFTEFLDYAMSMAGQSNVIQIGDLLEVWEVQWLYEIAFDTYCHIVFGIPYTSGHHNVPWWQRRRFPHELLARPDAYASLIATDHPLRPSTLPDTEHRRKLPAYFGVSPQNIKEAQAKWRNQVAPLDALALVLYRWASSISDFAAPLAPAEHAIFNECLEDGTTSAAFQGIATQIRSSIVNGDQPLDITSYEAIEQRIKLQYPELSSAFSRFTEGVNFVRGNHDTKVTNQYLTMKFTSNSPLSWDLDDEKSFLEGSVGLDDEDVTLSDPLYTLRLGSKCKGAEKGKICVEHGHAFDPFNSNLNYFRWDVQNFVQNAGYHSARDWFFKGKFTNPGNWFTRYLGYRGDVDLEEYALDRANAIFDRHKSDVRLIVMGHTHVLDLRVLDPNE